jgi:hypothetical protein
MAVVDPVSSLCRHRQTQNRKESTMSDTLMDKRGMEPRFGDIGSSGSIGAGGKSRNVGKAERWMSALGGAALTAFALKRRSRGSIGLALAGVPLLMRGATGHCSVYQALGIDRGPSAFKPAGADAPSTDPSSPEVPSPAASSFAATSPGTPGRLGPQTQDETGRDPIGQNF